ncbi:MAG: SDR family oxidoreductase [Dehalococcoidia bacterium]
MKLFITGVSGLLGSNMAQQLLELHEVAGCYHSHPFNLAGITSVEVDLSNPQGIAAALRQTQPDLVVNTVALTDVEACEADPELAYSINVTTARHVAAAAQQTGGRLIHLSTDHLSNGINPWQREEDTTCPLNVYAKTKLESEKVVQSICPEALVIRTNFYGWGNGVRISFSDWILGALNRSEPLNMFTDVWFTPILINDLTALMLQLSDGGATGIFNVAGKERVSKHAFALQLAEVYGLPATGIHTASVTDFSFKVPRPRDMSLSSQKAEDFLRKSMPTLREGLGRLRSLGEQSHQAILERAIQSTLSNT